MISTSSLKFIVYFLVSFCFATLCGMQTTGDTTQPQQIVKAKAPNWNKIYQEIRESLTTEELHSILDRGVDLASKSTLSNTLANGGTAIFPHCDIRKCGHQIAAVAHASLEARIKTGKKQILLIGVMHPLTETLKKARMREREGNILNDPCRGVFGPGLPGEELFSEEFSIDSFIFLINHEAKRMGIEVPEIVIRYPYLVYGEPETLPGIEELQALSKQSIVVTTGDLCHHGTAYGPDQDLIKKMPISPEVNHFAYTTIEKNLQFLAENNLLGYRQYCIDTISDTLEVGQILRFLLGPLVGYIHDIELVDVSHNFPEMPLPNWVATSLIEL